MAGYRLGFRVHAPPNAAGEPLLSGSILVDLLEGTDWREQTDWNTDAEPELLVESPAFIPAILSAAEQKGFCVRAEAGKYPYSADTVTADGLRGFVEEILSAGRQSELYPLRLFLGRSSSHIERTALSDQPSRDYDEFLQSGGLVVDVNRSALSVFASSTLMETARQLVDSGLRSSNLPVDRWDED